MVTVDMHIEAYGRLFQVITNIDKPLKFHVYGILHSYRNYGKTPLTALLLSRSSLSLLFSTILYKQQN